MAELIIYATAFVVQVSVFLTWTAWQMWRDAKHMDSVMLRMEEAYDRLDQELAKRRQRRSGT